MKNWWERYNGCFSLPTPEPDAQIKHQKKIDKQMWCAACKKPKALVIYIFKTKDPTSKRHTGNLHKVYQGI